ncbi:MAG: DEAD/DEAH box helicase family protein [Bacteroidia bacterium]
MKLKFESNQTFQREAIDAITDLFEGQPLQKGDFSVSIEAAGSGIFSGQVQTEFGIGNNILLNEEALFKNLHIVQDKNDLDRTSAGEFNSNGLNFSVEMETGTGKTYVYLRTIFELSRKYGFKKYIIVVPGVAIREGTLKTIEITKEHFRSLYNNIELESFVYDSKKPVRLKQFATSNHVQIMVINIDAFNKETNVFNQERNQMNGYSPKDFINSVNPIVIIDEPQSVDKTEKAKEAIKSLNPLCIFRYSATHANPYNLVYRLDPVRAYQMRLVKQIVVAEAKGSEAANDAYIKLLKTDNKKGIVAELLIHKNTNDGPKEKKVKVKQGDSLFRKSDERHLYKDGYEVVDINSEPGNEFIDFSNGKRLMLGQESGGIGEELIELQIRQTIQRHLDKELLMKDKGIKVLSLFFIDTVPNYRIYGSDGVVEKGKYAIWFEKHYNELIVLEKYKPLNKFTAEQIHNGYFSQDKRTITPFEVVTNKTNTQAEDSTFNLIMRDKERLLDMNEPLRFIFSHSALKEGWDNPNVFQICSLREMGSSRERRQTLGRGLRLPVNQDGDRIFDENINKLTVISSEGYADFAVGLQKEYEDDCGVTFGKVNKNAFAKLSMLIDDEEKHVGRETSEKIWDALKQNGFIDDKGKITSTFDPKKEVFTLNLPPEFSNIENEIIETLESYRLERHIKQAEEPRKLRLKSNKELREQDLDKEFEELWNRIKHKTTYEVVYSSDELIANCIKSIGKMEKIEPVSISYREALLDVEMKGVTAQETRANYYTLKYKGALPDIITYLQNETELTRATLVKILTESNSINYFLINPQRYMDAIAAIIRKELYRLMVDGIKYEKIGGDEWHMRLFEDKEVMSYLSNRCEVKKSVYDAIVYESEIERRFAEDLDKRDDIKLFVKLPSWFEVDTPIGKYNPDWAIVKENDSAIYLVCETKGTRDFLKLRTSEADKIKCGKKHFEILNTTFKVAVSAKEI